MKRGTKEITMCGMFAALIAVGAFIKIDIPLPLYTMHFTLQWFFVLLAGFLLGKRNAAISVIVYLCVGLVGVPVFAAGGGPMYVLRPGFGFLLGFVPAAYLIGFLTERLYHGRLFGLLAASVPGLFVYYGCGAVYFYLIKNFYAGEAVSFGLVVAQYCLITIVPDFILCVLSAVLAVRILPVFRSIYLGQTGEAV